MKDAASARVLIKVSGVTTPEDAEAAVNAGADCVACVFYAASPRYVTLEQAWRVRRALAAETRFVGIFVDTPLPLVKRVMDHCGLDWAQLFGSETREEVEALGHAFKGVTCLNGTALDRAAREHGGRKVGPEIPGLLIHLGGEIGSAWEQARPVCERTPTILAGSGLGPATIDAALRAARPFGLDVWDAVEERPGKLDRAKLDEFVAAVRSARRPPTAKESE